MKFISTRGKAKPVSFSEALIKGLAEDGGLYVPEKFPSIKINEKMSAVDVLAPFLKGDKLEPYLKEICDQALNFETPITELSSDIKILELFHGPTCAFKDIGARFLAECFERLHELDNDFKKTILVATSGDTGGAVASAFYLKNNFQIKLLFPENGVTKRQKKQLTCWGANIESFAVRGDFDNCQRLVKEAFIKNPNKFSSANSINIGRLLPQMIYYALTSINNWQASFVIPSGNMGNVVACFWAKELGFPIDKIYLSTNANTCVGDYFTKGEVNIRPTIKTFANAMDVGNPSNLERLVHLFGKDKTRREYSKVLSVSDEEIKETIKNIYEHDHYICCPHTATAMKFAKQLEGSWFVVATAHPAKFETIIEPILNKTIIVPYDLKKLLDKESKYSVIDKLDLS